MFLQLPHSFLIHCLYLFLSFLFWFLTALGCLTRHTTLMNRKIKANCRMYFKYYSSGEYKLMIERIQRMTHKDRWKRDRSPQSWPNRDERSMSLQQQCSLQLGTEIFSLSVMQSDSSHLNRYQKEVAPNVWDYLLSKGTLPFGSSRQFFSFTYDPEKSIKGIPQKVPLNHD